MSNLFAIAPRFLVYHIISLGSAIIRNRIAMSALTRNRALDTIPNEIMAEYYGQRAVAGAGLVMTEDALITRPGTRWP
ncbi:hypothetical protein LshimejAT787_1102450 [Lyophyllum shimeji]|uniref:NADH:flavin oxidoreductase/NADH oxidase N-terminal domain-containing protein n=1 Tax=Lyophyllum shimeji TaxID=47721 RepID=A0A9P3PUI0_LYOSH|nr:hypothetical protein LshimejAT787_1102450 [Lyophyllum shimeji]